MFEREVPEFIGKLAQEVHALIRRYDAMDHFRKKLQQWRAEYAEAQAKQDAWKERWTKRREQYLLEMVSANPECEHGMVDVVPPEEFSREEARPKVRLPVLVTPDFGARALEDVCLAEEYAALAAIHDCGWPGDKIDPWPKPDSFEDAAAFKARCIERSPYSVMQSLLEEALEEDAALYRGFLFDLEKDMEARQPTADDGGEPAKAGKAYKKATINERMAGILSENGDATGWNCRMWAEHLKCSKSTVVETATWKRLENARLYTKAERMKDRHRKPKASEHRRK